MDTSVKIILAAERLFARHGFDGVSLRQIAIESQQRNKYAVQYHFGEKDALIRAVFAYRVPAIDERRRKLLSDRTSDGHEPSVRDLIECLAKPLATLITNHEVPSHYIRFLAEAATSLPHSNFESGSELAPSFATIDHLLREKLQHRPDVITGRIRWLHLLYIHLLADLERFAESDRKTATSAWIDMQTEHIIDMCTAAVEAPIRQ